MGSNHQNSQRHRLFVIFGLLAVIVFGILFFTTRESYWLILLLVVCIILFGLERNQLVNEIQEGDAERDQLRREKESYQAQLKKSDGALKTASREVERIKRTAVIEREGRNQFWRHISHELRTPLNGIINFSHMIGLGFYGEVSEKQVSYLTRIEQSGWYLLNMLNDLSDLAKIETGDLVLNKGKIDLFVTCEEALATLHSLLTDDAIQIVRDYPETWPTFSGDERRIKQVLVNLLRHSAKQIEDGFIALRLRHSQQKLTIIVEDTAGELTAEQMSSLFFEINEQGATYNPQATHGAFGLSVAKHLIEAHQGTLKVKANKGIGTIFTITLPLENI